MKIAIAGYGIEGKSSYAYFRRQGHDVTIVDERNSVVDLPENAATILGEDALGQLADFDIVIRTPSLAPAKLSGAKKVWSATNEFLAKCPAPIIGVTGTKGKGTTCSLIASVLRQTGKTVHLVGNIGVAALDVLESVKQDDIVVFELSSFQLWDIESSPHIAVLLMIEPDHLDVHNSFQEYIDAKTNITRYQSTEDTVVFNSENTYSVKMVVDSIAKKVPVPSNQAAHVKDGFFWYADQQLCSVDALKIPGRHNYDNACAAIAASWSYVKDPSVIEAGLADFTGLPHRLKYVRTVDDVAYYDDSIATTVGSTVAALQSFAQPKIVILGGSSKGIVDFSDVANAAATANVRRALLIGEQASKIEHDLGGAGVPLENLGSNLTMNEIVKHAQRIAQPGDVVLLSPACASFDMFKSYADRGDQFVAAVNEL